jgi:hypothetical protein
MFYDSFIVMREYNLLIADALEVCRHNYHDKLDFVAVLTEKAVEINLVAVPKYNGKKLRIKAVNKEEMLQIKKKGRAVSSHIFNETEMVFGEEKQDLNQCLGCLLSCSSQSESQINRTKLAYEYSLLQFQVFGIGFGSRSSVLSDSPNVFTGKRHSSRSSQTPSCAAEHVAEQQYHREDYGCPIGHCILEKLSNRLNNNISAVAYEMHPEAFRLIENCCNRIILTSGGHKSRRVEKDGVLKNSNKQRALLGYSNISHRDMCDRLGKELTAKFAKNAITNYEKKMIASSFFSMPTTCAYQVLWKQKNGQPECTRTLSQHFVCKGLGGLALPIGDGFCHHFLGGSFHHYSSVPYVEIQTEKVHKTTIITNNLADETVSVLGWGRNGGSNHAKAQQRT